MSTRRAPGEPPISFTTLDDLDIVPVSLTELRAAPAIGEEASVLRDLGPDGLIVYGYKFRPCIEG